MPPDLRLRSRSSCFQLCEKIVSFNIPKIGKQFVCLLISLKPIYQTEQT